MLTDRLTEQAKFVDQTQEFKSAHCTVHLSIHVQCVQVGWIKIMHVRYLTIYPNRAIAESSLSRFGMISHNFRLRFLQVMLLSTVC